MFGLSVAAKWREKEEDVSKLQVECNQIDVAQVLIQHPITLLSLFFPFQGVYILQPRLLHCEGVIIHSNVYFNKLQGLPPRIMSKTKERRSFLRWRNALKWFYLELTQILSLDAWLYISIKLCLPFGRMERHSRRGFRVGQFLRERSEGARKRSKQLRKKTRLFLTFRATIEKIPTNWIRIITMKKLFDIEIVLREFLFGRLSGGKRKLDKKSKITSVWFEFRVRKSDFPQKKEN